MIAVTFVNTHQVIAQLLAERPTFIVKLISVVFIVAVFKTVWMTLWVATFCLVNVVQIGWWTSAEPYALHVITGRTQSPDINSGMEKKYLYSSLYHKRIN